MQARTFSSLSVVCVVMSVLLGILAASPALLAQSGPASDDFHSTTLNTGLWTFINPLNDSKLTMNGTNAVISVPSGVNHELWTNVTSAPRLMQTTGNVDFQVEVKFDLGMVFETGSPEEGVMVEQDSQTFIRFALFTRSTSSYVYVATFAAGQPTTVTYVPISLGNGQVPVWMRVKRVGSAWTMSWSTDGTNYTTSSTFSYALTVSQIGPYAANSGDGNGGPAPAFTASIDYFFNTASPIFPEDGGTDIVPTGVTVTPSLTTASVSWTTADWSSSVVNYGTTSSYGASVSNPALAISHTLSITGLTCATTYHYQVTSAASYAGATESTTDATFTTSSCGTSGSGPASDDFHSTTLNTGLWTFINPLNDSKLTMNGTNAVISVPSGVNHELWTNVTSAPRLMQTTGNVDFQVEVKFDLGMVFETGSPEEGVMVEQDSQTFIRFALFTRSTSSYVYVATFAAGQPTTVTYVPISLGNGQVPVWMRVKRVGSAWTMSWSTDGTNYTTSSTFSYALTVSQIGPYAANSGDGNGGPAPAFTASIDYFFNTASPIFPEDGGTDIVPTGVTVTPSLTTASVSWTTADWSSSVVNYGTTSSYGASVSNPALAISHTLSITGLTCATTYHYQVTSAASYAGATESTSDATFTTNSCGTGGGPTITGIVVTPGTTSATVAWTTNVAASSRVDYGLTTSYTVTNSNSALVTSHSLSLTGLTCATTYHYKITSVDGIGNSSSTTDSTFATTACPSGGPVSDDFHSTSLSTKVWTFVNPLNDSTLTMNGTNAVISVLGGVNHELWTNVTSAPRLMQTTGNVDFQVEVKFDLGMVFETGSPEEGVMVEQDSQTFIRFALFTRSTSSYVYVATFAAGQPTTVTYVPISLGNGQVPVWMRVKRVGSAWTMSWSTDGTNYTTSSTFSYALTVSQIGPYAANSGDGNGGPAPAFTASIDYFFNTASPIFPEDGGTDIVPTGVTVTPSLTTASVSWTTADWSSSVVNYGTTSSYGASVSNPALAISHTLSITGLTCATTYHYQVTSAASYAGATESTSDATFTTNSCGTGGGPTITGIVVTPGTTSATVAWTTNVAASSRVDYGLTTSYTVTNSNSALVTSHSLSLTGLTCATTYHYKITSVDGIGNSSSTTDSTFATTACPSGGPVSDDFHGTTLNPMWSFYAGCCGFQKMNGTDALLIVPSVTNHNIYAQNQGVGLMQSISNVDFDVVAKFDSAVTQGVQEEGIVVQQDAQNFMWFAVYHDGISPTILTVVTTSGSPTLKINNHISSGGAPFWLRVTRSGGTWTESWSTDGTNYTVGTTFSQTMVVSAIGPAAANVVDSHNDPAPSFTAAVDYFFNLASPITPADGGMAPPPNHPVINVWYGDTQTFGQNGIPQQWVNILGNMSAPSGIQSASYTLNGGASQFLRVGPNVSRLVDTGDFNVEIDHASLKSGANTVVITATDNLNNTTTHTVTLNWSNTGQIWPLPYSINWSTVTNIQNVAQIVDGQWALQPNGTVRTMQVGYDRLIALGDKTWTDYQVTAAITVNTLDCTEFSLGLVVGWTGHTIDPTAPQPDQPRTGHPFFGFGTYATIGNDVSPSGTLNIYANSPSFHEKVLVQDTTGIALTPGVTYMIKFAVQRNSGNTTSHLSLKLWPASGIEPSNWNLQADGDASTGSILLGTHHADVSFGNVTVTALP